ncbi:hypothetical protein BGZ95_011758 [Linnemannia exigua]|uniref:Uncharacterized protein n=1 Tax=Linnemannia exigua TaxID=604196 RepID=A0AAD4D9F9_9FUNG|nr:hypothetical protein BGZ95_011758 [Linnemannia exigua]
MTRRLLTISFSLFLVSAMMGTFPIPGTNSVSIPSGDSLLETPASPSAVSLAADSTAAAAATNTTEEAFPSPPLGASSITKPPPAGAVANPELIKILKGEGLVSEIPTLLPASSGFYKSNATPLTVKQPRESPQKREATTQAASPAFGRPPQQKSQQGQYQQWQQWGQQGGGGWSPSQGSDGSGQGQQPQWYPPQQGGGQPWGGGGGGQQWYSQQGQQQGLEQLGKPYNKPVQKRAITVETSTPTMGTSPTPPTPPQNAAGSTVPSSSPTFRMSTLVCNIDPAVRGLLHCSDSQDYYTLEQPPNPSNSADPRNRGVFNPNYKRVKKRAVTYSQPEAQGQPQAQGAATPEARFRRPQPYGSTQQSATVSGAGAGAIPEAWFRRPQPYSSQPQEIQSQAQVSKRAEAVNAWSGGAGAVSSAVNQATSYSSAAVNQAAAAQTAAGVGARAAHQHAGLDTGNMSKWSGGGEGSAAHHGKGKPGHGSGGSGKKWNKRGDVEELSKWSGGGGGNYGGDDWPSHYGESKPGYGSGGSGKKWSKRDVEELHKWSGGSGSDWTSGGGGSGGGGGDWDSSLSGYGKMGNSGWRKRQVSPGAPYGGTGGRPETFIIGGNNPAIPVPIDVQLLWDGSNVNLVTPSGTPAGPGGPGGPGAIPSSAGGPAIPVPINVDALVYPDGQMQVFPSGTGGI